MISFMRASLVGFSACCVTLANAQTAPAPVATQPSATSATFGDWMTRCARDPDDTTLNVCESVQSLVPQGQTSPIAQIAIGRLTVKSPLRLTVVLPVNVAFDSAPRMQIEEQVASSVTLGWRRCIPGGCYADVEIKPEFLTMWRAAAKAGQLVFRNAANQDTTIVFSFRGLGQALDALPKN